MTLQPPDRIWLQFYGNSKPTDFTDPPCLYSVTWWNEKIFKQDIEYVRVAPALTKRSVNMKKHGIPCVDGEYRNRAMAGAFRKGMEAHKAGVPRKACPYDANDVCR